MYLLIGCILCSVAMATLQWYQTPNMVMAAIKLKGIPQVKSLHVSGSSTVLCMWEVSRLMSSCYPPPPTHNPFSLPTPPPSFPPPLPQTQCTGSRLHEFISTESCSQRWGHGQIIHRHCAGTQDLPVQIYLQCSAYHGVR